MSGRPAVAKPAGAGPSLQRRLSLGVSGMILVIAGAAAAFAYTAAFDEAIEFQDDQLQQIATLLDRQGGPSAALMQADEPPDDDADAKIVVERLPPGPAAPAPAGFPRVPASLAEGFATVEGPGTRWRVYVHALPGRERVAVAQPTDFRDEAARNSAWRAVLPLAVLAALLPVLTWWTVRRLMQPLQRAVREIDGRGESVLEPVQQAGVPSEVAPFVRSINGLLQRVQRTLSQQQRFIADAAHELRSPLAALSLQIERLESRELNEGARGRVEDVRRGLERARVLGEQLLSLARVQNASAAPAEPRPLEQAVVAVFEELLPTALAKEVDLGLVERAGVSVRVGAMELRVLIRNLVENAIRHTPHASQVDVAVSRDGGHAVLVVSDAGPGIAPEDRERALQPFHRLDNEAGPGAGLGLAIVQTIAQRHGLELDLDYARADAPRGLRVRVRFPAPDNGVWPLA